MQFGSHTPTAVNNRGAITSPAAVFTRGLNIGGGTRWTFQFDNGYGASVIDDGYGRDSGLFELAVLDPSGSLTYDTPVTSDVLGWLTPEEVAEALDKIQALTPESIRQAQTDRENARRDERIAELRAELERLEAEKASV